MNYEGTRYTYAVTTTEVVMPNEVSKVQIDTKKPMLTLISCVPLGTAEKRLLVFAEQIYPDSSEAEAAETDDASTPEATNIPGKPAPTLLERLFGAR
jgi:sortase A